MGMNEQLSFNMIFFLSNIYFHVSSMIAIPNPLKAFLWVLTGFTSIIDNHICNIIYAINMLLFIASGC